MLTHHQLELIKATVPILQQHGVALTSCMYSRMLRDNPELRQVFNQGHQRTGRQQASLAAAVLAYAQNIENPIVMFKAVTHIASKHVSLGIRAEHYSIVGYHLIEAIKEVLGLTDEDELVEAWTIAYEQLAGILIDAETKLYQTMANIDGGWSGWRSFKIVEKKQETSNAVSFVVRPVDGGEICTILPGQFISVRVYVKSEELIQPRQYTVVSSDGYSIRICVKRIDPKDDEPGGMVSTALHYDYNVGDLIDLAPPMGEYYLDPSDTPAVLIIGGIGITTAVAMLGSVNAEERNMHLYFVCHDQKDFALQQEVNELMETHPNFTMTTRFTADEGRPTAADFTALARPDTQYYICGPKGLMKTAINALIDAGVDEELIFNESYGTGVLQKD